MFDFLDLLLERLPPHWGLVVVHPHRAAAALARLRAHDELAEFRERDLRFDARRGAGPAAAGDEPAAPTPTPTSQRLLERTHGLGGRPAPGGQQPGREPAERQPAQAAVADSGGDRHVFDYLLAEVLGDMPPDLRVFLLRCSVLSELTARRAAPPWPATPAQPMAGGDRAARPVRLGARRSPSRRCACTTCSATSCRTGCAARCPTSCPSCYRRAAAGEPDTLRRIGYPVRAGDWTEAEVELAEAGGRIITTVGAGAGAAPAGPVPAAAACALRPARAHPLPLRLGPLGLAEHARRRQSRRGRAFESAGDRLGAWRPGLYEAISYGSSGFTDEARRARRRAAARAARHRRSRLPGDDAHLPALRRGPARRARPALRRGHRCARVQHATSPLWYHCVPRSMQCGMPGMDGPLARFAAGALRVMPDMPTPLRALALALRGWGELSAGRVAAAAASVELADSDARWLGPPPNVRVFVYALLPILHALHGRAAEARSALDELMKPFDDPDVGYRPRLVRPCLLLPAPRPHRRPLGDVESARALLAAVPDDPRPAERDDAPRAGQPPRRGHRASRRARRPRRRGIAAYAEALADADALSVYRPGERGAAASRARRCSASGASPTPPRR